MVLKIWRKDNMIRKAEQMVHDIKESLRGGKGSVVLTTLLSPGEYKGKARMVARITLEPGSSIGTHDNRRRAAQHRQRRDRRA
jgi:hypothetical protein